MQLTTQRDALLETLGKVKAVVGKGVVPSASTVLLVADKHSLTITGTDFTCAVVAKCKATVAKAGSLCVEPSFLIDFLKGADTEKVTLKGKVWTKRWKSQVPRYDGEGCETSETVNRSQKLATLSIEAGAATSSTDALPPSEFPKTVPEVKGKAVKLPDLPGAFREVMYAVAVEDARPVLNALCFQSKRGRMIIAAADGFRLAVTQTPAKGLWGEQEVLVPLSAAKLVEKLMKGPVTATLQGKDEAKAVAFTQNGLTIFARCTAGTYPGYDQLIPKRGRSLAVATEAMLKAVKTVLTLKPYNDTVRLRTHAGQLVVSATVDNREASVKVPAKGKAKIAFNGKYLRDLLARAEETFTIRITSPSAPGVVKTKRTTHVIMPMHAQW